jgi:hypothetical protein
LFHTAFTSHNCSIYAFSGLSRFFIKEKQTKGMKGETRKIYRALLSFYKNTIIPMTRWSFVRAGFLLKPENLLGPVGVNETRVLERIEVPELPVDEAFMYPETNNLPTWPGIHIDGLPF